MVGVKREQMIANNLGNCVTVRDLSAALLAEWVDYRANSKRNSVGNRRKTDIPFSA